MAAADTPLNPTTFHTFRDLTGSCGRLWRRWLLWHLRTVGSSEFHIFAVGGRGSRTVDVGLCDGHL